MLTEQNRRVIRVLLVEDDRVDRRAIVRFVAESILPYELTTASSLAEARQCVTQATFDVAIVDHDLGDGTGLDLLADLGNTPAIVLTGAGNEQIAAAALALQVSDYIVKDAERGYLHLLTTTIEKALTRKWTEGELKRYASELEREIAQRKSIEESLRRSEEHLKLALVAANMGTWEWNIRTNQVIWSDGVEGIFGLPSGTFGGTVESYLDLVISEDRFLVGDRIAQALENGGPYFVEYRIRWPSSTIRWLRSEGRVFEYEGERPLRMAGTVVDITERKEADEKLQKHRLELAHVTRLNTMGEMATGLAHEINQPLSAIMNYARGCMRRLSADEKVAAELGSAIEHIATEAARAAEIIRRIRSFVRKRDYRRSSLHVNDLVREVIELMTFEARNREINIHLSLGESLPLVSGDSIQLEQVLLNLVRNGIEAMDDPKVTVRELAIETKMFHEDPQMLEISVIDTGSGLPATDIDQLFDSFFTTKLDGLGMGLSISRSIVEAHGGRLWAVANSYVGASFRFTLPGLRDGPTHAS